jgi:hypothetical protein
MTPPPPLTTRYPRRLFNGSRVGTSVAVGLCSGWIVVFAGSGYLPTERLRAFVIPQPVLAAAADRPEMPVRYGQFLTKNQLAPLTDQLGRPKFVLFIKDPQGAKASPSIRYAAVLELVAGDELASITSATSNNLSRLAPVLEATMGLTELPGFTVLLGPAGDVRFSSSDVLSPDELRQLVSRELDVKALAPVSEPSVWETRLRESELRSLGSTNDLVFGDRLVAVLESSYTACDLRKQVAAQHHGLRSSPEHCSSRALYQWSASTDDLGCRSPRLLHA